MMQAHIHAAGEEAISGWLFYSFLFSTMTTVPSDLQNVTFKKAPTVVFLMEILALRHDKQIENNIQNAVSNTRQILREAKEGNVESGSVDLQETLFSGF